MTIDTRFRELPPPGVYRGVPGPHYHGWKAASSSRCRILGEGLTPLHLRHDLDHPQDFATDAAQFGTLGHTLVLQPELFEDLYDVRPGGHPNSNAYKAAFARLQADRPFVTIMKAEDIARAKVAKKAVLEHPLAGPLFAGGETELTLVWHDPTGVICKARLDSMLEGITDLKFTGRITDQGIARVVGSKRYDLQAAFYLRGAHILQEELAALGFTVPDFQPFAFCFVEADAPHDIRIHHPKLLTLGNAEEEVQALLRLWAQCELTGRWPGTPPHVTELPEPSWLNYDAEQRIARIENYTDELEDAA